MAIGFASTANRQTLDARLHLLVLAEGPSWISLRYPAFRDSDDRANDIEHALRQVGGVTAVRVDLLTARIKVRFDPARLDKSQIRLAILAAPRASGLVLGDKPDGAPTTVQVSRRTRLVVGGVTLAGLIAARLALGVAFVSGGPLLMVGSVATLVCGYPILRSGLRALTGRGPLGTDALVTVATAASLLLGQSVTALAVVCLLDLGEWLQEWVQARTQRSLEALLGEVATSAWVVRHDIEILVPTSEVAIGEIVVVRAGDRVPVDGIIVEGAGLVEDTWFAGTPEPTEKRPGDEILVGARLLRGSLRVRTERTGADSAIGQLRLKVAAERPDGAPIARVGQRFAGLLVPASIGLAVLTLLLTRDPVRAISMLLIACPCAAGLSAPSAMTAALHVAARRGVLFRSPVLIEAAARIDSVILDVRDLRAEAAGGDRSEAISAIRALRQAGLQVVLLGATGDVAGWGERGRAARGGVASFDALRTIMAESRAAGRRVAVVSDRLNGLPISLGADLLVAFGGAPTVVALDLADVVVTGRDLVQVAFLLDLSRRTLDVIRQNYGLSFLAEVGGLFAGALGVTHPVAAATIHSLSTLGVLVNSALVIEYSRSARLALPEPSVMHTEG